MNRFYTALALLAGTCFAQAGTYTLVGLVQQPGTSNTLTDTVAGSYPYTGTIVTSAFANYNTTNFLATYGFQSSAGASLGGYCTTVQVCNMRPRWVVRWTASGNETPPTSVTGTISYKIMAYASAGVAWGAAAHAQAEVLSRAGNSGTTFYAKTGPGGGSDGSNTTYQTMTDTIGLSFTYIGGGVYEGYADLISINSGQCIADPHGGSSGSSNLLNGSVRLTTVDGQVVAAAP